MANNINWEIRNKILLDPQDEWIKNECSSLHKSRRTIYVNFYPVFHTKKLVLSRFIMGPPDDMVVDHINGDIFDNRRSNLRICTQKQNLLNRKSSLKYRGVRIDFRTKGPKKWQAYIFVRNTFKSLGYHLTPEDAAKVRDKYAKIAFGEYTRLNFEVQKRP